MKFPAGMLPSIEMKNYDQKKGKAARDYLLSKNTSSLFRAYCIKPNMKKLIKYTKGEIFNLKDEDLGNSTDRLTDQYGLWLGNWR